jgi:AbrB family looped-hinge helix DNA binding protein
MKSKVSVRGQTVIPKAVREELNISQETVLEWKVKDGVVVVMPLPADPIEASYGMFKGKGSVVDDVLNMRKEERKKERELEERGL